MRREWFAAVLMCAASFAECASEAHAQPIGSFRWQLLPFCNVLTLNVTQSGAIYTLDGFDDQCGAAQKASIVGAAFLNPDGSVGMGLTTVIAPGGAPVHIDARIGIASLGGPWRDSAGNTGAFAFTPGPGTGGSPRPVGPANIAAGSITSTHIAPSTIGSAQIDLSQVQARVAGACPSGKYMRGINADGTVLCETPNALVKHATFAFVTVPPSGLPPVQLASLTFTAPVTGSVLFDSRGYCNASPLAGSDNQFVIAAGESSATAFNPATYENWGVMGVPMGAASGLHQPNFTSRSRMDVVAGATYTMGLFARHESGATNNTNCTGSFTAQIFTGTLP
jgi:hypothetical protein